LKDEDDNEECPALGGCDGTIGDYIEIWNTQCYWDEIAYWKDTQISA